MNPTGYVVDSWNEESIDFNGCPSSWNGIVCNGVKVAGVVLDNLGLSANVDLSVFSNLTMLVKLSMSNNSISGKIPNNIGDFKGLVYLDISDNLFFSSIPSIPPGLGDLGSLHNISLAGNKFSGSITDSKDGLISIQSLDFSRNSFSGEIPSSLTELLNLVYLNLSLNGFEKKIPKGFDAMVGLKVFDLHDNSLDGNLNAELWLLTTTVHVDLSGNLLSSSSSQKQKFLPGLSDTIEYLRVLDLSYSDLSGELPALNFVYELQVLKLSNTKFFGFIPNDLLTGDSPDIGLMF